MSVALNNPPVRFPRLRALIEARRRELAPACPYNPWLVSDEDLIKALDAFIAKIKFGYLTPDEVTRAKDLEAFIEKHQLGRPSQDMAA